MVTEMEWKCCHGYSGEDCRDGPKVSPNTQVNEGRPRVTQTGFNTGSGQRGEGKDGEYILNSILGTFPNKSEEYSDSCCSKMSVSFVTYLKLFVLFGL